VSNERTARAWPAALRGELTWLGPPTVAGYSWTHEDVNRPMMRAVGIPAALATGLGSFLGLSRYFRGYLFTPENARRITRSAALHRDFASAPPALTPARAWRMAGPGSTAAARAVFSRVYGRHFMVWGNAALFALVITACVHPLYELPFTVRVSEGARSIAERQWLQQRSDDAARHRRDRHIITAGPDDVGPPDSTRAVTTAGVTVPGLVQATDRR